MSETRYLASAGKNQNHLTLRLALFKLPQMSCWGGFFSNQNGAEVTTDVLKATFSQKEWVWTGLPKDKYVREHITVMDLRKFKYRAEPHLPFNLIEIKAFISGWNLKPAYIPTSEVTAKRNLPWNAPIIRSLQEKLMKKAESPWV